MAGLQRRDGIAGFFSSVFACRCVWTCYASEGRKFLISFVLGLTVKTAVRDSWAGSLRRLVASLVVRATATAFH